MALGSAMAKTSPILDPIGTNLGARWPHLDQTWYVLNFSLRILKGSLIGFCRIPTARSCHHRFFFDGLWMFCWLFCWCFYSPESALSYASMARSRDSSCVSSSSRVRKCQQGWPNFFVRRHSTRKFNAEFQSSPRSSFKHGFLSTTTDSAMD